MYSIVFQHSKRRRKNASSFAGAENRTRTGTDVTPRDFKSLASAYSATSASLEASPGIEPGMKALQASALPLGYDAIRKRAFDKTFVILTLERETGFGPATSTLARWHSTTESLPQVGRFAPSFSATTIIYQINWVFATYLTQFFTLIAKLKRWNFFYYGKQLRK